MLLLQLHERMPFSKAIICANDSPAGLKAEEHNQWLNHIHDCLGKVRSCLRACVHVLSHAEMISRFSLVGIVVYVDDE